MANQNLTENDFPISGRWLIKNTKSLYSLPIIAIGLVCGYLSERFESSTAETYKVGTSEFFLIILSIFGYWLVFLTAELIYNFLKRKFFHFELAEDSLIVRSGIVARQERHMPYSRFQNVLVKQDLLDRVFGIKQVIIENASGSGDMAVPNNNVNLFSLGRLPQKSSLDTLGGSGNSITVPGLLATDAEELKVAILDIMVKHVKNDKNSGL